MKTEMNDRLVYQLDANDLQVVANQTLNRPLTKKEIELVGGSLCDFIDWFHAVDEAIKKHVIA